MKNYAALFFLFLFAQIVTAQFPSIKEKGFDEYNYKFKPQKQSGFTDFAVDSTNSLKVQKEILDNFLREKIYANVSSEVLIQKTAQEFETDSIKITSSFKWDEEKKLLYKLIKNDAQISLEENLVIIQSANFENSDFDTFLNENLLVSELESKKQNLNLFVNKRKQLNEEIESNENSILALENSNRNFEAQRLKFYIASLKKERGDIEKKFEEAQKKNRREFFIGMHTEPISRWMQTIYSKQNDRIYLANEATLQFNNEGSIVDTELATAFMGPLKLNFGTVISNQNNSEDEVQDPTMPGMDLTEKANQESLQRLVTGGGNTYLSAELPIGYYSSSRFTFYSYLGLRGSLEISEFSDDVDTTSGMYSGTGNIFASLTSDNKEFNFYVHVRYGAYGGSREFRSNLAVDDDYFDFGTVSTGVTINNTIRIAFTFKPYSSQESLSDGKTLVGIQFLPNFLKI